MSQEEMMQLQSKGVVYHQIIVPLTEEEKKMSESQPEEIKLDSEEKHDLS
jgi:tryptophanyl-tRNA synthetase